MNMSNDNPTETIETSDAEVHDLFGEDAGDVPSYHTILEVWLNVLRPARAEQRERVAPAWGSRMVSSYAGLTYGDLVQLRDRYFAKLLQLLDILELEVEDDEVALKHTEPADDATLNAFHYKNLLLNWQLAITQWELDWDCEDQHAAAELAAISEVHKQIFGSTGLTSFLDNIGFQFDEADSAQLAEAINELREGQ